MKKEVLLTVAEVAERLGISTARVRQLISAGQLPAQKLSARVIVVDRGDVEKFAKLPKSKGGRPVGK